MKLIRGTFDNYRNIRSGIIRESYDRTRNFNPSAIHNGSGTTVFISHKHDDLNDLKGLLDYLTYRYNVIPYIDSMDKGMPLKTCAGTAQRIKQAISFCNKFILLGTNRALSSKWCNWEVGIADKWKLDDNNMAILPMLDHSGDIYNGNEYLELYPYIDESTDYYGQKEYYVIYHRYNGIKGKISLGEWLNRSSI